MLYVGHFHGHEPGKQLLFTIVVEAPSVDKAVDKLRKNVYAHAQREDPGIFDGADAVFLDSLVEIKALPTTGLLTHIQVVDTEDDAWSELNVSIPSSSRRYAESYGWGEEHEDGTVDVEPFARLSEKPKREKRGSQKSK